MNDVDWLALWDEFAQARDNQQLEVAERIVYLDGRWNFKELSGSRLIAAARKIIRERELKENRNETTAFVGLVYAEDAESAIAAAIEQHNVRPADQKRLIRPAALMPEGPSTPGYVRVA